MFRELKQLWDTFTCVGRLVCPEGHVSSLNKSNPTNITAILRKYCFVSISVQITWFLPYVCIAFMMMQTLFTASFPAASAMCDISSIAVMLQWKTRLNITAYDGRDDCFTYVGWIVCPHFCQLAMISSFILVINTLFNITKTISPIYWKCNKGYYWPC